MSSKILKSCGRTRCCQYCSSHSSPLQSAAARVRRAAVCCLSPDSAGTRRTGTSRSYRVQGSMNSARWLLQTSIQVLKEPAVSPAVSCRAASQRQYCAPSVVNPAASKAIAVTEASRPRPYNRNHKGWWLLHARRLRLSNPDGACFLS